MIKYVDNLIHIIDPGLTEDCEYSLIGNHNFFAICESTTSYKISWENGPVIIVAKTYLIDDDMFNKYLIAGQNRAIYTYIIKRFDLLDEFITAISLDLQAAFERGRTTKRQELFACVAEVAKLFNMYMMK